MGKSSKKVKRQMQKKIDVQQTKVCQGKEAELEKNFKQEDYAKVLDILAELITAKDIKPDLMYKGAYSYFMLGDYERAAQWVTNTLSYAPNDVNTRILLARLCFIQNRHDDGLAIYDFLVENYHTAMSMDQKWQIFDSCEYYVRREANKLRQKFPHLAQFLSVASEETEEPVMQEVSTVQPAAAGEGSSALSALQRLKAKLQAMQTKDEAAGTTETAENTTAEELLEAEETVSETAATDSGTKITEIVNRECSLREKVQLLNKFAAGYYLAEDYATAVAFLTAALKIDAQDTQTLKNMALTQAALGNNDRAQAFVANIIETDFVLLQLLKNQELNR